MSSRVFSDYFTTWHEGMAMSKTAVAAVRAGYGVVPVRPGGKIPLCTLTPHQRSRDKGHACGTAHVITKEATAKTVFDRLAEELGMEVNIGIVAAPSRLVVVDADTTEAVESFVGQWAQAAEDSRYLQHSPTVSTPGSLVNGEWRHRNGGHWYFDVPEGIELPEYPTQLRGGGGFEVRWGNQMTVAPPSRRPEGPYVVNGDALEVPPWLLGLIRDQGARRSEHIRDLADRFVNDDVVAWSLRQEWGRLLIEDHWDDTSKLDTCGCQIWEKPGGGTSSRKSATAHDAHCSAPIYANVEGHGALHLWTDDPPEPLATWMTETGKRTITLFEYVVLVRYSGDEAAARVAEGIDPDFESMWEGAYGHSDTASDPYTHEAQSESPKDDEQRSDQEEQDTEGSDKESAKERSEKHPLTLLSERLAARIGVTPAAAKDAIGKEWLRREARVELDNYLGAETVSGTSWLPVGQEQMLASLRRDRLERADGVLERSDGPALFPVGKLHELYGQSSSGKTFLMMVAMLQQVLDGHRVLYCDFEDTLETFIDRYAIDLGIDIEPFIAAGLLCYANPNEPPGDLTALINLSFRLVVVDSLSEVVSATADGSLKDGVLIRRVLGNFRRMATAGAAVVIIAHGSEKVDVPGSSLGASEIRQALTGQDVLLQEKRPFDAKTAGHSLIYIAKDRGSDAGGDSDINERALTKVQRRLWGAMVVTPHPPELEHDHWYTTIEIEPATHAEQEPPKERKIDQAERMVIAYLNGCKDHSAVQAEMTDDLADEHDMNERTLRRAVRKLDRDGMVHEAGESIKGGRPSPIIKLGPAPEQETP
jgi:hypothetical protein